MNATATNLQTGDDKFLLLINENKGIIFKICNSYCHNADDRDDLAQEIIYQLWRSVKNYDDKYKFTTWMYRVALNTAISFYRKETKSKSFVEVTKNLFEIADTNDEPATTEINLTLLQQFINELQELDKALMILYLEEKTYAEIAEILGITETNVATKISRTKEKLKQKFLTINK
jgi:RNA polymerase sigma factor (sigma-70 family)